MTDLDEFTCESDPARLRIVGTWLVEESDECTGGACGLGYGHEPGCGQEPIVDLSTVPGWGDLVAPLIEARVREAEEERDRNKRAAVTLGKIVERQCRDVLDATGMHHVIDDEGDGDWALVWERLAEIGAFIKAIDEPPNEVRNG